MFTRLLMIAILVGCAGSVQGQSLAEVAAKDKERRAKTGGSARSFTDTDLKDAERKRAREGTASAGSALPPSAAATRSDSSAGPPPTPDSNDTTDSSTSAASKKSRGAEYKARLDATNVYLKHAEEKLKAAEKDWNMVMSHPWALASALDGARSRLEAARKSVGLLRSQRDDLEDAARREGIPPGYLR